MKQFPFITHLQQPVIIFTKSGAIVTWNSEMEHIIPHLSENDNLTIDTVFESPGKFYEALEKLTGENAVELLDVMPVKGNKAVSGTIAQIDQNYVCFIVKKGFLSENYFMLFQSIVNSIPRQIVVIDDKGTILFTNDLWIEFINNLLHAEYDLSQLLQQNFFEVCEKLECFDRDFRKTFKETVHKVIEQKIEVQTLEHPLTVRDTICWMKLVITPYIYNDVTYCVVMLTDITEQKHYQNEIKLQRDTFEKYLDISPFMIVILDEKGNISLTNKKACQILGYDYDELNGKNWFDTCVPQEMRDTVRNVYFELMKGNITPVEFYENPVITKDGSLRLIAWHNTILTDVNGNIIGTMSSGEDITEKKQMEIELLKSTTNLKAIVKAFPDLYVVADRDGIIYDYQFGEEMKLYVTREQAIGKPFYVLLPEYAAQLYKNAINEVLTKNTVVGIEYPIEIEDKTHWREARLVPMMKDRVLAVIRDVTRRKETEIALAESEKRYRHLVNRLPAAVVEMNVNGDIVFVNEYFTNLTGYALKDLNGTHWFRSILHPHEDKRKIRQFIEMIQRGDVNNFEIRIINRQGHDTHITMTTSNVYNVVGKLERIICTASDITPIVVLRDKLKEMAIKDELTGLYNRRGFTMLADQQLRVSKRTGRGLALFYIDMDNMKVINDTMGHHEGDKALIDVAGILRLSFRDSDIIGRLGGDEFAVFAVDCENQYVEMMQQRIVHNTNDFNSKNLRRYYISLSIGSIYIGDSSANLDEVLAIADSRMYQNKMMRKKQK